MRLLIITVFLVTLAVACSARPAEEEYDYADEPAEAPPAPSTKAPSRHGPVGLRQARGPSPLLASRAAKTTAAPVKPAEPEVVNEPEDISDEGPLENEEVVPATEAPKKTPLRGMIVRPFRSNQELLAALKRKRAQEHTSGGVVTHPPTVTTPAPVEVKPNSKGSTATRSNSNNNSSSGRRTFSRPNKATTAAVPEVVDDAEATPKKQSFPSSSRRFTATRGKPAPVTEDAEEDAAEEAPSRSAKSFRGGRRA